MFAYRTIGNVHPQGKPRVYFACHPDDLPSFLEEYSLKTLHIQDCAIWYETDYSSEYDIVELEAQLAEMQLIMMPVTSRLLTSPNRAMDLEFVIAQEKHIPILPIMMEDCLDEIYTRRFGDLQYINPFEKDRTKRSFNEVFESFIKAVLVGEELANRIRSEFEKYIFLSYRKKDRINAQKLMKQIHKWPVYQDIAIWYDEFLVPGENFNDLISSMLKKSDLFTLVVTPNLINEINYVMKEEYPAAMNNNKPMLPVEMEPTDKKDLEKNFKGIPDCIRNDDEEDLVLALQKKLHINTISKNDLDPMHSFLIGLAYLDGIDVEVDHNRAVQLIRGAAEAGILDAMHQLVMMYETGKGVVRDFREGLKWRKKFVYCLQEKYKEEPGEEAAIDLVNGIIDLGDAFFIMGLLKEAKDAYLDALPLAESYPGLRELISVSYNRLGDTAKAQGQYEEAKEYYVMDSELVYGLAMETGMMEDYHSLLISYERLGKIYEEKGELDEAEDYYMKSLEISIMLKEKWGTVDALQDLAILYDRLGDTTKKKGLTEAALIWYTTSLEIKQSLAEDLGTEDAYRNLSISLGRVATIVQSQGRLDEAKELYEKELDICLTLAEETGTVRSNRSLLICYYSLGDIALAQGKEESAKDYYEKCLDICLLLMERTGSVEARSDLSLCYNRLGTIAELQRKQEEAKKYYKKCLDISLPLAKELDTVISKANLSTSYSKLGDIALAQNEYEEAKGYYQESLKIAKMLAERTGVDDEFRELSVCYTKLGNIALAQGKQDEAKAYYERSLEICSELAKKSRTVVSQMDLIVSYCQLGDIAQSQGRLEDAKVYYEKGVDLCLPLVEEVENVNARRCLSLTFNRLGDMAQSQRKLEEAIGFYEKCLDIYKMLAAENDLRLQEIDALQLVYCKLGTVLFNARKNIDQAKEMFFKVIEMGDEFIDPQLKKRGDWAKDILERYF